MLVVIVIAAIVITAAMAFLATGRGAGLSAERGDYAPLEMGPVSATDVALLRPPMGMWGYSKQATDEAMEMIAESIRERDVRIVALEQLVTDLSRDHTPAVPLGSPYSAARHRRAATGPFADEPAAAETAAAETLEWPPEPARGMQPETFQRPPEPARGMEPETFRWSAEPARALEPEPTHWSMDPVVAMEPPAETAGSGEREQLPWQGERVRSHEPRSRRPRTEPLRPLDEEAASPPPPEQSHD